MTRTKIWNVKLLQFIRNQLKVKDIFLKGPMLVWHPFVHDERRKSHLKTWLFRHMLWGANCWRPGWCRWRLHAEHKVFFSLKTLTNNLIVMWLSPTAALEDICLDSCIYTKIGDQPGREYCFKGTDLPGSVECSVRTILLWNPTARIPNSCSPSS